MNSLFATIVISILASAVMAKIGHPDPNSPTYHSCIVIAEGAPACN